MKKRSGSGGGLIGSIDRKNYDSNDERLPSFVCAHDSKRSNNDFSKTLGERSYTSTTLHGVTKPRHFDWLKSRSRSRNGQGSIDMKNINLTTREGTTSVTKPKPLSSGGSALVSTVTAKKVKKDQITYSMTQKSVGDQQVHHKFKRDFESTI